MAVHCTETPFNTVEDLVKAADEAVYRAKRAGRDRFVATALPDRRRMQDDFTYAR
jgi:PleD family two-component response regulator